MTKATFNAKLTIEESLSAQFGNSPKWDGIIEHFLNFGEGTTLGNFDLAYIRERTVADGANDDIDLAGVLSTQLGTTFAGAELVGLMLINKHKDGTANTTALTIGGGSNPMIGFLGGTTPTIGPIQPNGSLCLFSPHASGLGAITAGTGDILRVTNAAGAENTYQIALLARTA